MGWLGFGGVSGKLSRTLASLMMAVCGLLSVVAPSSAEGQSIQVMQVHVQAVEVPGQGFLWQLTALPTNADILTSDPVVRPVLERNLQFIQANNGQGDYNSLTVFQDAMAMDVPSNFQWDGIPDAGPQVPAPGKLMATFELTRQRTSARLKVVVTVEDSTFIAAHPVATTIGALRAHDVAGLPALTGKDKETQVLIVPTPPPGVPIETWVNTVKASAESWRTSAEHTIAYACAAQAFASAKKWNLRQQDPNDREREGADLLASQKVAADMNGYIAQNVNPLQRPLQGREVMTIMVGNTWLVHVPLMAIGSVTFQISGFRAGGDLPWDQFKQTNWYSAAPAGFDVDKKNAETQMTARLQKDFSHLQHTLVTNQQFAAEKESIADTVRRKGSTDSPVISGAGVNDVVVSAVLVPTDTTLTLGGGYSSDKGLSGKVSATVVGKGMSGSLTAEAGEKKQDGTLTFSLPAYYQSKDHKWNASLDLKGNFSRATDLELNQPGKGDTSANTATAEVLNTLRFATSHGTDTGVAAGDSGYHLALETAAGYSDVAWRQPDGAQPRLEGGGVLYLRVGLTQQWNRTFTKPEAAGLGSLDVLLDLDLKQGLDVGPGKFGFTAFGANLTSTFYFGRVASTDYFCRVILGGGSMTGHAPVTEEFELGGNKVIHGLEQDERTARGLLWQSVGLGASLESLLRVFTPSQAPTTSPASTGSSATGGASATGGQDPLKSIYLAGFVEFAEITQKSVSQDQDLPSNLQSFGGALEYHLSKGKPESGTPGVAQIRVGYAWSPQSTHRSGVFFTDFAVPF